MFHEVALPKLHLDPFPQLCIATCRSCKKTCPKDMSKRHVPFVGFTGFTTCSRLPFCKPVSVVKSVENLGEILVSRHSLTTAQQTQKETQTFQTFLRLVFVFPGFLLGFLGLFVVFGTLGWIRFGEAGDVIENSPYDLRMGQKLMDGRFSRSFLAQKFWILKAEETQGANLSEVTIKTASCCVSKS